MRIRNCRSPGKRILFRWMLLTVLAFPMAAMAQLDAIEYYFDNDPGIGLGQTFYASGDTSTSVPALNLAGLTPGAHRLFLRPHDVWGRWGIPYMKWVYVVADPPTAAFPFIVAMEYFFDTDPGRGNGTPMGAWGAQVDWTGVISYAGLTPGSHRLYIRAKDWEGDWSAPFLKNVFVIPDVQLPNPVYVNAFEYYIDTDPGIGLGIGVPITWDDTTQSSFTVNLTGLSNGSHRLFFRTRDWNGHWSLPTLKWIFTVPDAPLEAMPTVTQLEYFVGQSDPGLGNGTQLTITPGQQVSGSETVDVSEWANGTYDFFTRSRDSNGKWSLPYRQSVTIAGNRPPSVIHPIPNQSLGANFSSFIAADLDTVFNDPEAPSYLLTYSIEVSGTALTTTLESQHLLRLWNVPNQFGDVMLVVTATDTGNAVARDTFNVYVSPQASPPPAPRTVTITRSGTEDVTLNWTMSDTTPGALAIQRYLIFYRSLWSYPWQFLGATSDRNTFTYTHTAVARFAPAMFYSVHSWAGNADSFDSIVRELQAEYTDRPIPEAIIWSRLGGSVPEQEMAPRQTK